MFLIYQTFSQHKIRYVVDTAMIYAVGRKNVPLCFWAYDYNRKSEWIIGVAGIFSGVHFFRQKVVLFLVLGLSAYVKTAKLTTPALHLSQPSKTIHFLLLGECTYIYPYNLRPADLLISLRLDWKDKWK